MSLTADAPYIDAPRTARVFAYQVRFRMWLGVGIGLLDTISVTLGIGQATYGLLWGYVAYLVVQTLFEFARRRATQSLTMLVVLMTAAFFADILFMARQLHASAGGWWHGATFYVLCVVIAAATLPRVALMAVTAFAVVVFCGSAWLHASGLWVSPVWDGFPLFSDYPDVMSDQLPFGVVAVIGAAIVLSAQARRTRRTQHRYRTVVEASPYVVLSLDAEHRISSVNRAAERVIGRPLDDLVGLPVALLFAPEEAARVQDALARTQSGERSHLELRAAPEDERAMWFGVAFSAIEADETDDRTVLMVRDLTEVRLKAEENVRLERELEEARRLELVGRLVSGVAHELNNPLTALMVLSEQLETESTSADQQRDLRLVTNEARRARAIVRELLQVVRAPEERAYTSTELRSLLDGLAAAFRLRAEAQRRLIEVVAPSTPVHLEVDAVGIEQVVSNLLLNALHVTPVGGRVRLRLVDGAQDVLLIVEDTGAGIPEHARLHLFDPFFTTKAPGEGTGLGLAVSKAVAERHGGRLEAENGARGSGIGARFTLRLPKSAAARRRALHTPTRSVPVAASATLPPGRAAEAGGTPDVIAEGSPALRVLIVDDEPSIRQALGRWFAKSGWQVETSPDGSDALQRLLSPTSDTYSAVICDLRMPGASGMQVYARVAEERPELLDRFVIATGDVASPEVAEFLGATQAVVIEKPFELARLAEVISSVVATDTLQ